VQFLFVFTAVSHSRLTLNDYVYPTWADGLGWLMFAVAFTIIPLVAVIQAVKICLQDTSLLPRVRNEYDHFTP